MADSADSPAQFSVAEILASLGVTPEDADRRKQYLELTDEDAAVLRRLREALTERHGAVMQAFYNHLLKFDETRQLIADPERLERLKRQQWRYLAQLTAGVYDWSYIQNRLHVGLVHQRVGLEPRWYIGAYSKYLCGLIDELWPVVEGDVDLLLKALRALLKVVFLDMGLVLETYFSADRRALNNLKDYAEAIVCNVPVGLIVVSAELEIVSANKFVERFAHAGHPHLKGRQLEEVFPAQGLVARAREVLRTGQPQYGVMVRCVARPGEETCFEASLTPIGDGASDDPTAAPRRLLITIDDLAEQERLRDATAEADARIRAIVENVPEGIITIDQAGHIESFNPAAETLFGYAAEEVLGKNVNMLMPEPYKSAHDGYLERYRFSGDRHCLGVGFREVEAMRRDGTVFPIELSISEFQQAGQRLYIGIVRDVSERKEAEGALLDTYERLRNLIENTSDWVWEIDENGHYTYASPRSQDVVGYTPGEILGRSFFELMPAAERGCAADELRGAFAQRRRITLAEHKVRHKDGHTVILETSASPFYDADGEFRGYRGMDRDVTDRRQAQMTMAKLSSAVEQAADSIIITDSKGVIEYVNAGFEDTTGYSREEALGQTPRMVKSGMLEDAFYKRLWRTILAGDAFQDVFINRRKDGSLYYEEKTITPLVDSQGRVTHFVSSGKDITERMEAQEQLQYLAYHDVLTDLPNRTLFMDRLKQAMAHANRHDSCVGLLFMDLDNFKVINDSLGHSAGDRLLKELAARLRRALRESDTVARVSGDEFAILLSNLSSVEDVAPIAQKILQSVSDPFTTDHQELFVTTSIGVAIYPGDGDEPDELLKNADIAMYRAKARGRNDYRFFTPDMNVLAQERLVVENELRRALERDEFRLHFQPQVTVAGHRLIGTEALIRWQHATRGLVSPRAFIPVLEETGLIVEVGEWVLRNACQQLAAWRAEGLRVPRVAVNIAPRQLIDARFPELVRRVLADTDVEPGALELEITESSLMEDEAAAVDVLNELVESGISIAMDDFGTGYSSLSYLRRFPIRCLKIDREFVRDVPADAGDAELTRAIIAMSQNMNLPVVAEGVETAEQVHFLERYGCTAIQGFFTAPPMPAQELAVLLRRGKLSL